MKIFAKIAFVLTICTTLQATPLQRLEYVEMLEQYRDGPAASFNRRNQGVFQEGQLYLNGKLQANLSAALWVLGPDANFFLRPLKCELIDFISNFQNDIHDDIRLLKAFEDKLSMRINFGEHRPSYPIACGGFLWTNEEGRITKINDLAYEYLLHIQSTNLAMVYLYENFQPFTGDCLLQYARTGHGPQQLPIKDILFPPK